MRRLVLASSSPRRQKLLADAGFAFEVIEPDYEEDLTLPSAPAELVQRLSRGKAESVARRAPDAVIIAGDTIVVHAGRVLGKPKHPESAKEMLRSLSGTSHSILTGVAIVDARTGAVISEAIPSRLTFRTLSESEIDAYVASGEPLDKAGAYAVQGKGGDFVETLKGDMDAIVGLPMARLAEVLKDFGIVPRVSWQSPKGQLSETNFRKHKMLPYIGGLKLLTQRVC